ncbi:MAG: EAL domain-containing protein [Betaproteobacteria bacterium]|nr:EAL domain-containing protein [Betaproteobacteria bacterium]
MEAGKDNSSNGNNRVEILIAEDSATQREQLQHLLAEHGYAVVAAINGKEAFAAARRLRPMLIISDILMPELDGYGLCKAVKSDDKLKDVPVILLTTLADPHDILKGLECGADNFIRKPYEDKYLLSRIDYLLMNLELRKNQRMQMGVELTLGDQTHFITTERQQVLDMLISTYEQAVAINGELKLREKDLAHSNQVLNGLYRIAEGLNGAISVKGVAETALEWALELPEIQAGWVFVREGESGFRMAAARNLPPALECAGAMEDDCVCRRQLVSGALDHVTNILECERLGKVDSDTRGLSYHASIPLWNGTRAVGLMNLVGPEKGLFDDEELKVLYSVGNQLAIALERAHLHENLEQLVQERTARVARLNRVYSVLSGINTTIVRVRERDELFAEACRIAVEHGKFVMAWIGLFDPAIQHVTEVAKAGWDDGYLDQVKFALRGKRSLTMEALTSAVPTVCNDISVDERMSRWRDEALKRGYRSMAVFPLLLEQRAVGAFALYAPEPDFFDEQEMKLLIEMAGDISFALDHIAKEEKLNYLAYYDALTGLPNRTLFCDRVDNFVRSHAVREESVAVVTFNVERFRFVNDSLGRPAGDALLRQIGERLRDAVGNEGSVARTGSDAFAVSLAEITAGADVAHTLEEKIFYSLSRPFTVDGQELRISFKCGVALSPDDGSDAETLFRNAEAALQKARDSGDKYMFYAPQMNARVAEILSLENKLRIAIVDEQFVLHYQPKVDLASNRITSLEALIRWNAPDLGLVPPAEFIPILEETGMILEVGQWVLRQAAEDQRRWRRQGLNPPRVSVNISALQLRQKGFVDSVSKVIAADKDNPAEIDLEITESVIMQDIEESIRKLNVIKAMGVGIEIDDFGTGYSSLSYIARMPITALKIDRSFVAEMANSDDNMMITSTIVSLAHGLKLRVVAEGVETEEQREILKLLRCDEMQGYLFSRPLPADVMEAMLRA